jgi:predicted ATPase/DNA-binding winged helix-turn-helix (wHTH) protein
MNDLSERLEKSHLVQAGPCLIDLARRQVLVDGEPVRLGARAFDVLCALVERHDRVVPKPELMELVWPKLVVEDNNLQVQMVALRKLLGPQAITTVPGRGYRFTLPLQSVTAPAPAMTVAAGSGDLAAERNNLPAAAALIGRDDDRRAVVALLQDASVVSILGAGGIGKTRLALAVAAADAHPYPDGRWWIELAPINDASQIVTAVASAIGLQLPGPRAQTDALAAALARQRLLLVLDNCEHLAEGVAALIGRLRAEAPGVRMLVTTQELLKCDGEQVYRLGTLAVPTTESLEEAAACGAVALFVERAHAVDPRFRLGADNVGAVIDICRRLDGIPLAIELAASRVPLLGVPGLQARLDRMFNVLTGVARVTLRRHQTLRAALDWSYGLLSDDERTVFRRLGVFAGGFTVELAQAVAGDEQIDEWQVLDLLGQLIDKSLLVAGEESEPRYRMLEPTRAFALEQLASAGDSDRVLRKHAQAMVALAARFDGERWEVPMPTLWAALAETGNVRAALQWAMLNDRALACELLAHSWWLWGNASLMPEGAQHMLRLWPLPADLPVNVEAAFCFGLARLRGGAVGRTEVDTAARRAAALYRQLGNPRLFADALLCVAAVGAVRGDTMDEAQAALEEARQLIGASAPPRQQGFLAMTEGMLALRRHEFAAAAAAFVRQSEFYRRDGHELGEYLALTNLARVHLDCGDFEAAVDACQRAVDGLQRIRAPYGLATARGDLVTAQVLRGSTEDLLPAAREAFELARVSGDEAFGALMTAALHHARRGDVARAALVAGYAYSALLRRKQPCPVEDHFLQTFRSIAVASEPASRVEQWQVAGAALSQSQAAALAFDDAPLAHLAEQPAIMPGASIGRAD